MKKNIKIILSIFAIPFGVFMIWYGEMDDSPGGQLIGYALVALGGFYLIKTIRKKQK